MIDFILIMSIFWIVYGILGLFGIQVIPRQYRGSKYEKEYKKARGIGWILSGVPWLIIYFVVKNTDLSDGLIVVLLIATSIPSIIYSVKMESKFAAKPKEKPDGKDQKNGSHPKKKGKKHK